MNQSPNQFPRGGVSRLIIAFFALLAALLVAGGFFLTMRNNGGTGKGADKTVFINGVGYPPETEQLILSGSDLPDWQEVQKLSNLKTLDLRHFALSADDFDGISRRFRNVVILWNVPFGERTVPSDTEELTLPPELPREELSKIQYFTNLKTVHAEEYPLCDELLALVREKNVSDSDCGVSCRTTLYGVTLDSATETLKLNNIKIAVKQLGALRKAIPFFPNLKKIEMCDCNLSDEIMQQLREDFPDVMFVWNIKFLRYEVRTDAQVFSTLVGYENDKVGGTADFAPLFQYCTELRALDIGHHKITDISGIRNLRHLQVLIIGDNKIRDASPLADLQELNYIEIFFNQLESAQPFSQLPKLAELNICFNYDIKDAETLLQCKEMDMLYASHCSLSKEEVDKLKKGLPEGCVLDTTTDNAMRTGWRTTEKNYAIRYAFKNWKYVTDYQDWAHVTYREGAKLQEPAE